MAQTKTSIKTKRSYHKGHVAQDLLAAAARILKDESVEALSVRRLAREVGVTPANFYNHFPSLEDVLLTLAAEGFDTIAADTRRSMDKAKTRKEGLIESSVSFVNFAIANKQVFRIMFGQVPDAVLNEKFRIASDKSFAQLVRYIYGEWRYDRDRLMETHHRAAVAYAMFAMVYGLARNIIEDQFDFETGSKAEIRRFVEEVMRTYVDGTAAKLLAD
ncbi:MAG TPA: TetR/AcrR family transcriptional regulator [Rhizomicrobium sp.]